MNSMLILDVIRFELARSLTVGRLAIWCVLVAFPVALISVLRITIPVEPIERFGFTLYFLIPEIVCLLGLLLWATPVVSTEIEGQTWIYLAMRASGRNIVLLGKYLTAVLWTWTAAATGITISVLIIGPPEPLRMWIVMNVLAGLSCLAHAAIFLLIGVLFQKRTMVSAVFYTLVMEYVIAFIPALINKLTVNYRLRGLLAEWMQWHDLRSRAELVLGNESPASHLFALAIFTAVLLALAMLRLATAQYATQQDG
ncbi:hypothetical protein [Roseimaritima ulvae]|uniref:ABC-2 family transporter protein n=1 Tax=Roseimaritima ulvae TaxID=980254 RepID=A0A5B9QP21_9BACT|nr:hypothetical protein [Roseimaritima ulvae]QEG39410.1 hypothetical protein UC8_14000 [Roseimaritima ulvae]